MNQISSLPGRFKQELNRMLSAVGEWAATLPQKFWDAGVNAVKNFLNALGIHSPGYMQIALVGEMKDTTAGIVSEGSRLVSNLASIGSDAVKSWGNPELKYDVNGLVIGVDNERYNSNLESLLKQILDKLNNNMNGQPTLIFNHYGDIDNEDRMQKFVDAVIRELQWDNKTAGRTV